MMEGNMLKGQKFITYFSSTILACKSVSESITIIIKLEQLPLVKYFNQTGFIGKV